MTDTIKDGQINSLIAEGKIFGDGAILRDDKTRKFLENMAKAKENLLGPKIEVLPHSPKIKPNDFKNIPETLITETICKKWGETPDSLVAINIAKLTGNPTIENMIVSETLDSTHAPAGIKKVAYQFLRRGDYDGVSFDNTEIVRFEFSELIPNTNLKDTSAGDVVQQMPDDGVSETLLSKNQFIDVDTGLLVTYYSTPIEK